VNETNRNNGGSQVGFFHEKHKELTRLQPKRLTIVVSNMSFKSTVQIFGIRLIETRLSGALIQVPFMLRQLDNIVSVDDRDRIS